MPIDLRDYVNNPKMLSSRDLLYNARTIYPVRLDLAIVELEYIGDIGENTKEIILGYFAYNGIAVAPRSVLGIQLYPRKTKNSPSTTEDYSYLETGE